MDDDSTPPMVRSTMEIQIQARAIIPTPCLARSTSENPAPVENHRQQLSLVYPSASNFHHRFSRVMRKRGNPYWVPRTHENLDKLALPEETDFEEVGNVQTVS